MPGGHEVLDLVLVSHIGLGYRAFWREKTPKWGVSERSLKPDL